MKKLLLILLAALVSHSAIAQDPSQHLAFKGVPIDGTLSQFVNNMKAKGFTGAINKDGTAVLKGDFAGYKGCVVIVSTLMNKDLVSKIGVIFPACQNWKMLEGNYLKLKEMLITKYGEPTEVVEEFQNPRYANDDSSKLHELEMDRCTYKALWKTDKGNLVLKLTTVDYGSCRVLLGYYDKINGLKVEAAAMDDL